MIYEGQENLALNRFGIFHNEFMDLESLLATTDSSILSQEKHSFLFGMNSPKEAPEIIAPKFVGITERCCNIFS